MAAADHRAVFFDLVGTLIHAAGTVGTQYSLLARRFGVEARAEDLDRAFEEAISTAPRLACAGRPIAEIPGLEKSWWRDLVRDVVARAGLSAVFEGPRFDEYFDALYRHFETEAAWMIYPDVVPVLSRLRADRCSVGLITNYDARVYPLLEALELQARFDCIAIPGIAGAAKPDPAIFRYALDRTGVTSDRSVYVGDLISEDVDGARAAGIRPILLDRARRHRAVSGIVQIESLDDLAAALGAGAVAEAGSSG